MDRKGYSMKQPAKKHTYSTLITDLASLIEQGRKTAVRYVNTALVTAYWLIGRRIVEYEQKGKEKAEYGKALLSKLAADLTKRFGKGFGYVNLNLMRQFYLTYPPQKILQTVSEESSTGTKGQTLPVQFPLSWSHYCLLIRLDDNYQREFYESECIRGNWSVRQLDRQMASAV